MATRTVVVQSPCGSDFIVPALRPQTLLFNKDNIGQKGFSAPLESLVDILAPTPSPVPIILFRHLCGDSGTLRFCLLGQFVLYMSAQHWAGTCGYHFSTHARRSMTYNLLTSSPISYFHQLYSGTAPFMHDFCYIFLLLKGQKKMAPRLHMELISFRSPCMSCGVCRSSCRRGLACRVSSNTSPTNLYEHFLVYNSTLKDFVCNLVFFPSAASYQECLKSARP